jgi:hypothetical protein
MPTVLQFRRGTTSQNNAFTGSAGEVSIDTDKDTVVVHDGSTAGGHPLVNEKAPIISADILNGQSDGVGNIGNATVGFNTLHAKATSAQYADLAEKYNTDEMYAPGTVVVIGGDAEVTACTTPADHKVLGIVSTDPAYKMNQNTQGQDIALTGRVPCKVTGQIVRGDLLVTSDVVGHAQAWDPANFIPGSVVGKALEAKEDNGTGVIEVAVGKV